MAGSRQGSGITLTQALEDYSATHPESVEELLQWPARRFDAFYVLYQKRMVIDGLSRQKDQMVSALWSNSNWDDDKGTRKKAIEDLEENYEEAVEKVRNAGTPAEDDGKVDMDNPFLAAAQRGVDKIVDKYGHLVTPEMVEQEREYIKGHDQAKD